MKTWTKLAAASFLVAPSLFAAEMAPASRVGEQPFVYLRCQSTSYDLNEKSLMHSDDGEAYSIQYTAQRNLLLSGGESCIFTVTDEEGKINDKTVEYVADIPFLSNVSPGEFYSAVPAGANTSPFFRLQYEEVFGEFSAVFFLKEKQFGFSPVVWFR